MRQEQFTLKASTVQAHARALLLAELDLTHYKPALPAPLVVSLLLLASVWQTSLSCAEAMRVMRRMMGQLRLTINEKETRQCALTPAPPSLVAGGREVRLPGVRLRSVLT